MITTSCSLAGSGVDSLTDEHSGRKGSGEASVGTGVAARAVYGARPRHPRLLELLRPASGSLLCPASGSLLCPASESLLCPASESLLCPESESLLCPESG